MAQLKEQIREKRLNESSKVMVLGGRDYANVVLEAFAEYAVKVETSPAGFRQE